MITRCKKLYLWGLQWVIEWRHLAALVVIWTKPLSWSHKLRSSFFAQNLLLISFWCAAGTVPYKARTTIALYEEICHAPLRFPEEVYVSDSIKHLLTMLLHKDPGTRVGLNGVMSHPWVTHNGLNPIPGFFVRLLSSGTHDAIIAQAFDLFLRFFVSY